MQKIILGYSLLLIFTFSLFSEEKAIPGFINFQGILKSEAGTTVDGEYKLIFRIYDSQIEGTKLWEETHDSVMVKKGYFNVVLGSITPFPKGFFDDNRTLWLGIQVGDNGKEFPRKKLLSVAFAFQAEKSDVAGKALSLDCDGCVSENALTDTLSGKINGAVTQEQLNNMKNEIDNEIAGAKNELQGSIDQLSGNLSTLSSDFSNFQSNTTSTISGIQADIDSLNSDLQSLNSNFSTFKTNTENSINELEGKTATLSASFNNLSSAVDGLTSDLNEVSDNLSSLQTTVNDHINNKDVHKTVEEIFNDITANLDGEGSGLDADTVDGMHAKDLKIEEHLLRNGGFEQDFLLWNHVPDVSENGPVVITSDNDDHVHSGTKAVKFVNKKDAGYDKKYVIYKEYIPVMAGEGIHFSMWYFGESDLYNDALSNFSVKIVTFDKNFVSNGEILLQNIVLDKIGEGVWKNFTYDYKVPESGEVVFISFKIEATYDPDRNFTFYIDDIDAISDSKSFVRLNSFAGSDKPGGAAIDLECDSCVDTSEISDGTIVDADISGDAGILPKKIKGTAATLTGNQIFDNGTLFIDAIHHRVGIGMTSTPSYKLHVKGDIYADSGWVRVSGKQGIFFQSYGGGWYMTDSTWIRSYGGKNVFIDKNFAVSGNVGIGTTSPQYKLHVTGNSRLNNVFLGDVGHGTAWAGFSHSSAVSKTSYALLQDSTGLHTYLNIKSGGGYIGFRVDNTDKMVIKDNGNVGIGTSSPIQKLDVYGNIIATAPLSVFDDPNGSGSSYFITWNKNTHVNPTFVAKSSNNYNFTLKMKGYYRITINLLIEDCNSNTVYRLHLYKNNKFFRHLDRWGKNDTPTPSGDYYHYLSNTIIVYSDGNDYFSFWIQSDNGDSTKVYIGDDYSQLSIEYLGR